MRLAELVGTLSLATDAGTGVPDSHGLRGAILAVRLAALLGEGERTQRDAYYLALLATSGCTADAASSAALLGDEVAFGTETLGLDWGRAAEMLPAVLRSARRGKGPIGGMVAMAGAMGKLASMMEVGRAHCEVAVRLAGEFGFDEAFRSALFHVFERWDGSGFPTRAAGDAIPLAIRIAQIALDVDIGHRLGGVPGAISLTKKHAGRGLDPAIVERFVASAEEVCAPLDEPSPWAVAIDAEPGTPLTVEGSAIDEGLRAIAHFADLKSRFTRGHSTGVSERAAAGARVLRLGDAMERAVARAGLVHDVGCVAVTAALWDKAEPLTDAEREKVRLHSYVGERILARAPALSTIAEIATQAHERLDGGGYHRRLPAVACPPAGRVLAAADVYQALIEDRPHRPARSADDAATELDAMAKAGTLCRDAVSAVLAGAGRARGRGELTGLTEREVQVLRLLARGLTNKEIASSLDISTKTASRHLENIFAKLGVTTRAAATLIAMQKGLVG
jgi:HD-GYP domain-containing protein (c-di-GMP phosphodiesterase class II)